MIFFKNKIRQIYLAAKHRIFQSVIRGLYTLIPLT